MNKKKLPYIIYTKSDGKDLELIHNDHIASHNNESLYLQLNDLLIEIKFADDTKKTSPYRKFDISKPKNMTIELYNFNSSLPCFFPDIIAILESNFDGEYDESKKVYLHLSSTLGGEGESMRYTQLYFYIEK